MIVCPKCKSENMLGAIFCRGCGQKLNIDDLRPEDIAAAANKNAPKKSGPLRTIISTLVLLVVLGILGAIFMPPEYQVQGELPEDQYNQARARLTRMLARDVRAGQREVFTLAEVNHLTKGMLDLTEEKLGTRAERIAKGEITVDGFMVPYDLTIELLGDNRARLILLSKLYDKLPVHTVIVGQATASSDTGLWFTPETMHAGRLPVMGAMFQEAVLKRYLALIEQNQPFQEVIRPGIHNISSTSSELTISR